MAPTMIIPIQRRSPLDHSAERVLSFVSSAIRDGALYLAGSAECDWLARPDRDADSSDGCLGSKWPRFAATLRTSTPTAALAKNTLSRSGTQPRTSLLIAADRRRRLARPLAPSSHMSSASSSFPRKAGKTRENWGWERVQPA